MLTWGFRFLDIINYLGPGTSYTRWVKAYDCETVKAWFPYEWFDSPEKLDFPGLPEYEEWYSSLRVNTFSRGKNGRRVSRCSKKGGCAPLQIGFGTTTIWMWHQVWTLWKR